MQFQLASADAIIVTFSNEISLNVSQKIKFYYEKLKHKKGIIELIPSYTTLYIQYDIFIYDFNTIQTMIETIDYCKTKQITKCKEIIVPVWYDCEVGWDLQRLSQTKKISIDEIIQYHTATVYTVYAIGFAPGFAYLGEVIPQLSMPRLQTPRKIVPKGSVAIANTQTAIYPQNSPGGWNILGRTPFEMFDTNHKNLCPVNVGDTIRFEAIDKKRFLSLGGVI
jgi:KipI family sensor histidine kinase inhibitor